MLIAQIIDIIVPRKNTKKWGIAPMADNLVLYIATLFSIYQNRTWFWSQVILPVWTHDKNIISHAVVVKPVDGPYLFEEQDVIHSQQPYTLFYP